MFCTPCPTPTCRLEGAIKLRAGRLGDIDGVADMVVVAMGQQDMGRAGAGLFDADGVRKRWITGKERIDQNRRAGELRCDRRNDRTR